MNVIYKYIEYNLFDIDWICLNVFVHVSDIQKKSFLELREKMANYITLIVC